MEIGANENERGNVLLVGEANHHARSRVELPKLGPENSWVSARNIIMSIQYHWHYPLPSVYHALVTGSSCHPR